MRGQALAHLGPGALGGPGNKLPKKENPNKPQPKPPPTRNNNEKSVVDLKLIDFFYLTSHSRFVAQQWPSLPHHMFPPSLSSPLSPLNSPRAAQLPLSGCSGSQRALLSGGGTVPRAGLGGVALPPRVCTACRAAPAPPAPAGWALLDSKSWLIFFQLLVAGLSLWCCWQPRHCMCAAGAGAWWFWCWFGGLGKPEPLAVPQG